MELSQREYEVAGFISKGYLEKQIAEELFISKKTVHNHAANIRKKWNCRNAVDICRTFILKLDNPKQYFTAVVCLALQISMTFACPDMDVRKSSRARARVRTTRTFKTK